MTILISDSPKTIQPSREGLDEAQALAHIGSWKWDLNRSSFIWSDELYRIFGIPSGEKVTFRRYVSLAHPDDRSRLQKVIRMAWKTEKMFDLEHRLVLDDGTTRILYCRLKAAPGKGGRKKQMIGTAQDITELKTVQEALRASEERFRRLIKDVPDYAILMLDVAGCVATWNTGAERITGYTAEEALGRPFSMFFTEEERRLSPRKTVELAQKTGRYENEGWRVRKDGSRFWANVLLIRILDIEGNLLGFSSITRDETKRNEADKALRLAHDELESRVCQRTAQLARANRDLYEEMEERKKAEESLHEIEAQEKKRSRKALANRSKKLAETHLDLEELSYVASHDLQEPLRKIHSFIDLIDKESPHLNAKEKNYFLKIQAAATLMKSLIDDVLHFSGISNQEDRFDLVSLRQVIADVIADFAPTITSHHAKIEVDSLPSVVANASQMRQLFQNLVGNALKFVNKGEAPTVRISSSPVKIEGAAGYQIEISDCGIGFEEKYLERIFRPFQRLNPSELYDGTGIGLAICRKIVQFHSGTLTASSNLGKGSVFSVCLLTDGPTTKSKVPPPPGASTC